MIQWDENERRWLRQRSRKDSLMRFGNAPRRSALLQNSGAGSKYMMNGTGQKMERTVMLVNKGGCRAGGTMAMRDGTGADSSAGRCWETRYRWAEMGHDKKSMLHVRWDEGVLRLLRISMKSCFFKILFFSPFINLVRSETNNINNMSGMK